MTTKEKTQVTFYVGNNPSQVEVGADFAGTVEQLASNCKLRNFTLVINGKSVEEGETIPEKVTAALNEKVRLLPYDEAAN